MVIPNLPHSQLSPELERDLLQVVRQFTLVGSLAIFGICLAALVVWSVYGPCPPLNHGSRQGFPARVVDKVEAKLYPPLQQLTLSAWARALVSSSKWWFRALHMGFMLGLFLLPTVLLIKYL